MKRIMRLFNSLMLKMQPHGRARAEYIKKKHLFGHIGEKCFYQPYKLPLYSNLIHLGNNVKIASNVGFVTHDIIHTMLNVKFPGEHIERIGCIVIKDNVFIGSGTRILYDTKIGNNVIIGSASLVNNDVPDNSVYAGVPAKYICSFDEYIQKSKEYSDNFKATYKISYLSGINDDLAKSVYEEFIRKHEK